MRSWRYILGGRPHTLDDCLVLSRSRPPDRVTLNVSTDELVDELRILHQFVGTYRWQFGDREVCCTEVYGCVFLPTTAQDRKLSLAAANAKLRRRLGRIQQHGIPVSGADRGFEDSE